MEYFGFLYNLVLIILNTVVFISFLRLYSQNKSKAALWIAILFLIYILDVALLYMADNVEPFSKLLQGMLISEPYFYMILILGMMLSIRMATGHIFGKGFRIFEIVMWLLVAVAMVLVSVLCDYETGRIARFLLSKALSVSIFLTAFVWLHGLGDGKTLRERRFLWMVYIFYAACIGAEIAMFFVDIVTSMPGYRNLAYEVLNVGFLTLSFIYLTHKPAQATPQTGIGEGISKRYGLTPRETEILSYLAKGYSNRQISDVEYISIGTVKTHTHNLYRKLGINNRSDITAFLNEQNK